MRDELHRQKKEAIMEKCFNCYAENGLTGTGIKALAKVCGCTSGNLYSYFKNLDDLIIESTAYCMSKVEDEFMAKAPTDPADIQRFIEEVPYWTAEKHGKKYRLMYQVYTLPKYIEHGRADRHSPHHHHAADLHFRAGVRPLCHVRGRILPEKPDGRIEAGRGSVFEKI